MVIDLGTGKYSSNNMTFSPLSYLKSNYGVSQLDHVTITHPHLDHLDDILHFDSLTPRTLSRPKSLTNEEVMEYAEKAKQDKEKYQKYCEINNRYKFTTLDDDYDYISNPENWGGLRISSFCTTECGHSNFNNFSLVTMFEYENIKVVIPGDNEKASFEKLMIQPSFLNAINDSHILLAPHHGRESGYHTEFVKKVNPCLSIVSDGKKVDTSANNRYSQMSSGWEVYYNNGKSENRKCLSTNADGVITVKFGKNSDTSTFLSVKCR
jgi:competence protein ComEC